MIPTPDLAALYDAADGLTVSATFGAETTQVHFRQGAIDALGGDRLMSDYSMRYRASTLAGTMSLSVAFGSLCRWRTSHSSSG